MKDDAAAAPAGRGHARTAAPAPARPRWSVRRVLPEIALLTAMVALAIGLRAVAFLH
ncbi:hypothetical protein ACI7BZ_08460 [Xanthobacter sp. AM11]|uniref:hypothetical protein n=1 Tax=Xanthobacter sp. AM11 TaxID=3380643 RepID=UPI0039BF5B58